MPDRIKIQTWKTFHHAIPVFSTLAKRGIEGDQCDLKCCFCGFKQETVEHLFLQCWWSRMLWDKLQVGVISPEYQSTVADWLWFLLSSSPVNILRKVAIGIWVLWRNRNMIVHDKKGWSIDECFLKIKSYEDMFTKGYIIKSPITTNSEVIVNENWTILCDGSWCTMSKDGGFAAIAVRDNVIGACRVGWIRNCASPFESELQGIMIGLEIARELNLHEVDIVSDSTDVVWFATGGIGNASRDLLEKFQEMISLINNKGWNIRHIFRDLNQLPDALAKIARREC